MRKRWAFVLVAVAFACGSLSGWSSREAAIGEGFMDDLRVCEAKEKEPSAVFILITPGQATKECLSKTALQQLLGVIMLLEQGAVVEMQEEPESDQDFSHVPHDNPLANTIPGNRT